MKEKAADIADGLWGFLVVLVIFLPAFIIALALRPIVLLFDHRVYRIPKESVAGTKLGLLRLFCMIHWAAKEDGRCPACLYPKNELVKS